MPIRRTIYGTTIMRYNNRINSSRLNSSIIILSTRNYNSEREVTTWCLQSDRRSFFFEQSKHLGAPRRASRRPPTQVRPITNARVCVLRSTIKLLSLGVQARLCVCAIIVICCSSNRKHAALVCVCRFFISG